MSYHSLSECTLTPDERLSEASRIFQVLAEAQALEKLTAREREFFSSLIISDHVTVKQLFWLRDIKDKYL